jgi:hypothetical protein
MEGELVRGKLTTENPMSEDGSLVLVINGEPYGPEDAEFYLETASTIELRKLAAGGYNRPRWKEHDEDQKFMDEEFKDDESPDEEPEDLDPENGDWEDDK